MPEQSMGSTLSKEGVSAQQGINTEKMMRSVLLCALLEEDGNPKEEDISWHIDNALYLCWHKLQPFLCKSVYATWATFENGKEIKVCTWTAIICPKCFKIHRQIQKNMAIIPKKL